MILLRLHHWFFFLGFFLKELVVASYEVARAILFPNASRICPAIVAVPLRLKKNKSIAFLANIITLTPGTLSLDVSDDSKTLYVHVLALHKNQKAAFVQTIQNDFERRVARLMGEKIS